MTSWYEVAIFNGNSGGDVVDQDWLDSLCPVVVESNGDLTMVGHRQCSASAPFILEWQAGPPVGQAGGLLHVK
jgi:hypothetical protein